MAANFGEQVRIEAEALLEDATTVFRYSAQQVVEEVTREGPSVGPPPAPGMGGFMPVQLGNLRRSLRASTSQMPFINPALHEGVPDGTADIVLAIAGADLGETLWLGFTAAYAAAANYGHGSFPGYHFVEKVAARWPAIVAENEAKISGMRGN